jgi:penicillin amidase
MQSVWLNNVLQQESQRWLPASYANYDELLTAALEAALPGKEAGNWGNSHPVEIQHPVLGQIPLLRRWTGPGLLPQSGSGYTVKAVTRFHGPSERMTVDLADFDQSTLNLVTGQSGNFLSPHYMDQWRAWYQDFTFGFPFSPAAVERTKAHELLMEPK